MLLSSGRKSLLGIEIGNWELKVMGIEHITREYYTSLISLNSVTLVLKLCGVLQKWLPQRKQLFCLE